MMIVVNRIGDAITGSLNGTPFGVSFDEQKYALMLELQQKAAAVNTMDELKALVEEFEPLTKESYKEVVEHAKGGQYLFVNQHTGKVYLAINGKVSSKPLPKSLVDRIITSVEKKIDVLPLVKAWARFLRNPWYTDAKAAKFARYINTTVVNHELKSTLMDKHGLSSEVAEARATMFDVSFTQEGLLATYKVVSEIDWKFVNDGEGGVKKVDRFEYEVDEFTGLKTYKKPEYLEQRVFQPCVMGQSGDTFYSGEFLGHIIRVGKAVYLDSWDKVDRNDDRSCVKGLHVGGLRYVKGYQNDNTLTLNVFVDPMHIGGIDHDGTGALRVLKYFPHSAMSVPSQNIYHSSEYAKVGDAEYDKMIEEAVEKYQQKLQEADDELSHLKSLQSADGGARLTIQS
jgi:hypothetical protein